MSYGQTFSYFFDNFTNDVNYHIIADFVLSMRRIYQVENKIILDVGCGTGSLASILAKKGNEVIGVDFSEDMLLEAQKKNNCLKNPVLYLHQNLKDLDLFGTVGVAVSSLDTLNHLNLFDLRKTFGRLKYFVEPGGLFIFDYNSIYKHENVLANTCYSRESKNCFCSWQYDYSKFNHSIDISLDLFEKKENEQYVRTTEHIKEYTCSLSSLAKILHANSFEVLDVYDGYGGKIVKDDTLRYVIVSQRR